MVRKLIICWLALMTGMCLPAMAAAQSPPNPYHQEAYSVDSGTHAGQGPQSYVAYQTVVRSSGARWVRLHFSDYNLGQQSALMITSLLDGGQQHFDSQSLAQWAGGSAVFNGEAVDIQLHVGPDDQDIFFQIDYILVGTPIPAKSVITPQSLCGPDNRVSSGDGRVGRLFFGSCTAWLTSNGSLLTAGHCADFDPDDSGTGLPDGTLDLRGVVEFKVPSSTISGTVVAAHPNNQYPIVINPATSVVWNFDGTGQGFGKDWAVFRVNPNSNTGLTPYQAQGNFFRMTRANPANLDMIRITGYGLDNTPAGATGGENAATRTNQTATGPYTGETVSGSDIWHNYQVDTTGANSGSPIIWETTGFTIGIHTNAGCENPIGSSANTGTSFEHAPLQTALQNFLYGTGTVYVDRAFPTTMLPASGSTRDGTIFQPFTTIAQGVNTVSAGKTVSIVAGSYNEIMTINKAVTLVAPAGIVTIGSP